MAETVNKFCTECGNKLPEGSEFCNKCGAPVGGDIAENNVNPADSPSKDAANSSSRDERNLAAEFTDASNPYEPQQPVNPKSSQRAMVVGVILGVLLVAIGIIVGIMIHNNIVESEGAPSSEIIQTDPEKIAEEIEAEDEERAAVEQGGQVTPWGVVFDTDTVSWTVNGDEASIVDESTGIPIGLVCTKSNTDKGDERKQQVYVIGKALVDGSSQEAHLVLYYLKNGNVMHWATEGGQTAIQSGLLSLDDIANALELNTVSGLEHVNAANFVLNGGDASSNTSSKSAHSGSAYSGSSKHPSDHTDAHHDDSPFYGVWIGASKSESEAKKIAYTATSKGLSAGCVFSSNWSNLNQDAWWCVTAGYCSSESEAKALCKKAKAAGYTDAYVKYSGRHHI